MQNLIDTQGNRFLERWFSPQEISYCQAKHRPYIHFAARMAAKEAVAKAIGIRPDDGLPWKEIVVERASNGAPTVLLSGWPLTRAAELGIKTLHLSISHCDEYATATVIAEN